MALEAPQGSTQDRGHSNLDRVIDEIDGFVVHLSSLRGGQDALLPRGGGGHEDRLKSLRGALEELAVAVAEVLQENEALEAGRETLEAERNSYRDLFQFVADGYLVTDRNGIIEQSNHTMATLLRIDPKYIVGKPLAVFVDKEYLRDFYRFLSGLAQGHFPQFCNLRLRRRGGTTFPAMLTVAEHWPASGPRGLLWLVRDMTEYERHLAQRLIAAQEEERRRIAHELHDEAGQALAVLSLGLGALQRQLTTNSDAMAEIERLQQITNDVALALHDLAVSLRPASIDRLGLPQAVRQLTEMLARNANAEIRLQVVSFDKGRLPPELETTLFRLIQEALSNAVRHAGASEIGVVLQRLGQHVLAIIEDNGQGFDLERVLASGRLGLLGMRERCEMLGGALTIETAPGKGTTVYARIPLYPDETSIDDDSPRLPDS